MYRRKRASLNVHRIAFISVKHNEMHLFDRTKYALVTLVVYIYCYHTDLHLSCETMAQTTRRTVSGCDRNEILLPLQSGARRCDQQCRHAWWCEFARYLDIIYYVTYVYSIVCSDFRILAPETSVAVGQNEEMLYVERRENKSLMVDNTLQPSIRFIHIKDGGNSVYDDDPDAPSPEEQTYGSEDEWSGGDARKKKRKKPSKAPSTKKTPSSSLSAMNSAIEPPKPFICCCK